MNNGLMWVFTGDSNALQWRNSRRRQRGKGGAGLCPAPARPTPRIAPRVKRIELPGQARCELVTRAEAQERGRPRGRRRPQPPPTEPWCLTRTTIGTAPRALQGGGKQKPGRGGWWAGTRCCLEEGASGHVSGRACGLAGRRGYPGPCAELGWAPQVCPDPVSSSCRPCNWRDKH